MDTTADRSTLPPPATLRAASLLWLAVVALEVLHLLVEVVDGSFAGDLASVADSGGALALGVGVLVLVAAFLALLVLCAAKQRRGRNWARIVLTVVGVIVVAGLRDEFGPPDGAGDVAGLVVDVVEAVAIVVAVVLAFRPASNAYVRAVAALR